MLNLSSAAVVIGPLRVKIILEHINTVKILSKYLIFLFNILGALLNFI